MTDKHDKPKILDEGDLDKVAGGFKVEIEGVVAESYEPVTLERGLRSDGELVQAVSEKK